ncbi:MAG: hypothetical protein E7516_01215 [Ruminococcaceae bacterium]|nr:hypothetical protein [Oscillospiraceae bacterium]
MKTIKTILICIVALLMLSSCAINSSESDTKNPSLTNGIDSIVVEEYNESTVGTTAIMVDGVLYRNKFQGDLILRNPQYSDETVLKDTTGQYHRIEGTKYDLLYNVNSEVSGAPESVYCRDDQWQEQKKYYSDSNNFTYQCIIKTNGVSSETIDVDKMDIVKLNELLAFCEENAYDPNAFAGTNKTKAVSTSSLGDKAYRFKMSSNDGLFSVDAKSFSILDNALVYRYYEVMPEDKTLIIDVPKELSEYFISLINNSALG